MVKAFYHDTHPIPLPEGHRFPANKYSLLRSRLQENKFNALELIESEAATIDQVARVHNFGYITRVVQGQMTEREMRRVGFPWSPELVERSLRSVGCTIAACQSAVIEGTAVNLGGGTHHAYPDHGEGFCVFNDAAVAARNLQINHNVNRILILDCDVHQGNGTAAIFKDDASVFTFSIHGQNNFPLHKEMSDLDIALPDRTSDVEYISALETGIYEAFHRAHADFVIYLAGADPFTGDTLGRMSVSKHGLAARDQFVLQLCKQADIPVAIAMAGGYAQNIQDTIDIHINTIQITLELFSIR